MSQNELTKRSLAYEAMLDLPLGVSVKPWVISKPYHLSVQDLTAVANGSECVNVIYDTKARFPKITSITRIASPEKNMCFHCRRNPHIDGKDKRKLICLRAIKPFDSRRPVLHTNV